MADWLELELLLSDRDQLTETQIRGLLSDDLGVEDPWTVHSYGDDEDDAWFPDDREDDRTDVLISDALLVVEARSRRAGDAYPLVIEHDSISRLGAWQDHPEWTFLTLLEARLVYDLTESIPHASAAVLFEKLVKQALMSYTNGRAARFGWPLDGEFTGTFPERLHALTRLLKERAGRSRGANVKKDFGLDVVAWLPFDSRDSQTVILCQCAIGRNFAEKTFPMRRWEKLIDFVATPIPALAVPFDQFGAAGPDEEQWRFLAVDAGILLDRTRISRFAVKERDEDLVSGIREWVSEHCTKLPQI